MTERRAPAAAAPTAGDATRVAGLVVSTPSDSAAPAARVLVLQRDRIQFLGHPSDAARWLDPALPQTLTLLVEGLGLAAPIPLEATVRDASEQPEGVLVTASLHPAARADGAPDALAMLLRRRAAKRVAPSVHHPVTVIIRNPEGRTLARGMVRDLSITGVGVLVPKRLSLRVEAAHAVEVELDLDDGAEPLALPALVRYRLVENIPSEDGFHGPDVGLLGVEFDADARRSEPAAGRLSRWVERQDPGSARR